MFRPSVVIVSPALAAANNGNWQTASRWQAMVSARQPARITAHWPDAAAAGDAVMLALHAGRSAESIQAWAQAHPGRGLAVVLTGTDLYTAGDWPQAGRSLEAAQRLVVLQSRALQELQPGLAGKARVIYQSCEAHPPQSKPAGILQAVMVGHLRDVKSPGTLLAAARMLREHADIRIDHIGDAQGHWAAQALQAQADAPNYRWRGPMPHAEVRAAIADAHVLVHTSAVEGGAHVIMEAVRSGTPVLASAVAGNLGMLGEDYAGCFAHGDAAELARLLLRLRQALQEAGTQSPEARWLELLRAQCALRAPLFDPEAERAALFDLLDDLQDLR